MSARWTERLAQRHRSFLDALILNPDSHSVEQLRRARVLTGALVYSNLFIVLMFAVRISQSGLNATNLTIGIASSFFFILAWAYRRSGNTDFYADLFILFVLLLIMWVAWFDGGLSSRVLTWLPAVTLFANFLGHKILGFSAFLLASVGLSFLLFAHSQGIVIAKTTDDPLAGRMLASMASMLFVSIIASSYEDVRRNADAIAQKARKEAENIALQKTQFLANMSHELRTPMNGILGMLQLLLRAGLDDVQLRKAKIANDSAESMLKIVENVLAYSKVDSGELGEIKTKVRIEDIFRTIENKLAEMCANKGLKFACTNHCDSEDTLVTYADALKKILSELSENAVKFTDQGRVDLELRKINTEDEASFVWLVRDSGIGIDEQYLDRLFEAFSQADGSTIRSHGGLGLGLALANKLAYQLDARLEVSSKQGTGSGFTLRIPLNKSNQ